MGDVFDAMNRAKRERGEGTPPPAGPQPEQDSSAWGALGSRDDQAPALPIAEITQTHGARPLHADGSEGGVREVPALKEEVLTARRIEPASVEAEEKLVEPVTTKAPQVDSSLNGYAAEVVVHYDRGGAITEQYRAIRTQILSKARSKSMQTHVITSSAPGEGKSVTSVNLGVAFAELTNHKTLLVEGDLRRPSFKKLFHRDPKPGMLQLLRGECTSLDEAIQPTVYPNLQFISSGGHDHLHSTELLSSPRMGQILDRLKDRYEHIFIDSPPVISVTDAAILGAMCDQVLLVVRLYKTPIDVVDRARRLLRANNCEVAGVILTHMRVHVPRYLYKYGYYYYYGYGYSYGSTESGDAAKKDAEKATKGSETVKK